MNIIIGTIVGGFLGYLEATYLFPWLLSLYPDGPQGVILALVPFTIISTAIEGGLSAYRSTK